MSLFSGKATGDDAVAGKDTPTDWSRLKVDVVARLDVAAEYQALGVRFARAQPDAKGRRECHAIGRPDESPSAFVNVATGIYHDSGGEGESLHLFQFAVKHGGSEFGRWIDAARYYADKAGVPLGKVEGRSGGRTLEARYDYRDHEGEVRYAVFRYVLPNGKKTFTQHPPDGKGGWKWGAGCMDGVEPLPYRLPELLDSADEESTVWAVEGEKAAEALASIGLVATTSHGGSSNAEKTWPRFLEAFRGRIVNVLPDNDPGGRAHARKVCEYLHGVAHAVHLVELPGLPPKGDVVDWLAEGGTRPDLFEIAASTLPWTPDAPAPAVEEDLTTRDATVCDLRRTLSEEGWLWPGWIPTGALTLIAAEGGTGKTRFCFDLHRRLYNGLPWPDGAPGPPVDGPTRVLWVVADNQHREMCDIPDAFGIPDEAVVLNAMASDPYDGTSLQTAEELADFEARIKRVGPAFVVIDTITNTSDAKAQDSSDAKKQYKPLQEIATRQNVAILCVTHLNAGGKVLGRRAVEKVRVVIQLECPDPENQEHRRKLFVSKSKALKPKALGITMTGSGNEYDEAPPEKPEDGRVEGHKRGPVPAKLIECMDWLSTRINGEPSRVSEIRNDAEAKGFTTSVLYKARDQLGLVETLSAANRKLWGRPIDPGEPAHHPAF